GHAEMASRLFRIVRVFRAMVFVSQDVLNQRTEADRTLLTIDLSINTKGGWQQKEYNGTVERYERSGRLNGFPAASRATAALAFYVKEELGLNAELLTTNRAFGEAFAKAGGKVALESKYISGLSGKPDYIRTRRLLGATRSLNVGASGQVLPTAPKPA